MKRIAFVNQRYGIEVNGGSEYYTRLMAEHLNSRYDVEILTTRAIDHISWKNHYPEGENIVNNIKVRRFSVKNSKDQKSFEKANSEYFSSNDKTIEKELRWIDEQGPLSEDLIKYIEENKAEYDIFIFVTYLYYPVVRGLEKVANKSIFIPTAHEEPFIHFKIYENIFNIPKAFIFLSDEEKKLVQRLFHNENIKYEVLGVGVDEVDNVDSLNFRNKYKLEQYIIYVGRIEVAKGCVELFDYFLEYKKNNNSNLKLVIMGKSVIPVPKNKDIINLGFVSEVEKLNGIAGAEALVMPSKFESLSMVVLESMNLSVPVIVNAKCEVLKGHCIKSNAGLYYEDYYEFEGIVNYLLKHNDVCNQMKINAKKYVDENYQWDVIVNRFGEIIEYVTGSN